MRIQILMTLLATAFFSPAYAADSKTADANSDIPVPPLMVAELDENAAQCSMQMMQNGLIDRLKSDTEFQKAVEKKFNRSALVLPIGGTTAGIVSLGVGGWASIIKGDENDNMSFGGVSLAIAGVLITLNSVPGISAVSDNPDNTAWTFSNDKLNAAAESLANKFGNILYLNVLRRHVLKSLLVKEMLTRIKAKNDTPLDMFQFLADAKLRDDDYLLSEKQRNALTQFVAGKFPGEDASDSYDPLTNKKKIQFLATCKATLEVYSEGEKASPDIKQVAAANQKFLDKLSKQVKLEVSIHQNDDEPALTGDDGVPAVMPGDKANTEVK
jgi:hypothetical protein